MDERELELMNIIDNNDIPPNAINIIRQLNKNISIMYNRNDPYQEVLISNDLIMVDTQDGNIYLNPYYFEITNKGFEMLWNVCPERSSAKGTQLYYDINNQPMSTKKACFYLFRKAGLRFSEEEIINARIQHIKAQTNLKESPTYKYVQGLINWLENEGYNINNAIEITIEQAAEELTFKGKMLTED